MLVPITWSRALLASLLFAGALMGVAQPDQAHFVQPLTIYGQFKSRTVMLTATTRSAGAIESLQWGGMEFLDANDHGRDLQSALSFDNLGECDNPTEAGASRDGGGVHRSSSRLLQASVAGNVLRTHSQMAYWLRLGQHSEQCKLASNEGRSSPVSSTHLAKTVRFLPGFNNVLEHKISFEFARARSLAVIEVLTAYMPERFGAFYRFNPATSRLEPLSDGPGEQELPVVLATYDGEYALGLFTPQTATGGLKGPGYGRFRLSFAHVTKSNVVFRLHNAKAGAHRYLVYSVFGTLEDVRSSLSKLHEKGRALIAAHAPQPDEPPAALGTLAKN